MPAPGPQRTAGSSEAFSGRAAVGAAGQISQGSRATIGGLPLEAEPVDAAATEQADA